MPNVRNARPDPLHWLSLPASSLLLISSTRLRRVSGQTRALTIRLVKKFSFRSWSTSTLSLVFGRAQRPSSLLHFLTPLQLSGMSQLSAHCSCLAGASVSFRWLNMPRGGSVIGSALRFSVQLPAVFRLVRRIRPVLDIASEHVRTVIRSFFPVFVSRGVTQIERFRRYHTGETFSPPAQSTR